MGAHQVCREGYISQEFLMCVCVAAGLERGVGGGRLSGKGTYWMALCLFCWSFLFPHFDVIFATGISANPVSFALKLSLTSTSQYKAYMLALFISHMWQSGYPGKETWNPLSFSFMSLNLQLAYKSQQSTFFFSILLRSLTFLYTCLSCESLKATRIPPRRALGEGERTFPREDAIWTMGPIRPSALAEKKPPS